MKRHISILTFLLGVFAAAVPVSSADAATAATLTITSRGYWEPGKTPNNLNRVETPGVISPDSVTKSVSYGDKIKFTAKPPTKGYAVDQWYQDDDAFMDSPDPIADTAGKLTIDWTYTGTGTTTPNVYLGILFRYLKYNVKYDENGGSSVSDKSTISYTKSFTLAAAPSRTGYTFSGWKDINGSGTVRDAKASVKGASFSELDKVHVDNHDVTLQAQWTAKQHTVTFDGNGGGSPNPSSKTVTYDSTYGDLATCSRTGYTFAGWWTAASGGTEIKADTKVQITADQRLYAHWTARTYTVTFDGNGGGTPSPTSMSVTYDSTYGTLPSSSRTGYTFAGWWTAASGGTEIKADAKVQITAAQTLYAHWTAKTYTITYTGLKDGATNPDNPTTYTIETPTITFAPPTPVTGFTFAEWDKPSLAMGSWGDKTVAAHYLTWIDKPTAEKYQLTYNGGQQTIASGSNMSASGHQATEVGTYQANFTPNSGYCWNDGTTAACSFTWWIVNADLSGVKVGQSGSLAYTGEAQTPTVFHQATAVGGQSVNWTYSAAGSAFSPTVPSFTEAGSYTVSYKAEANNHNTVEGTFTVTIERAKTASVDVSPSELPYTKKEQGPTVTVLNCMTSGDLRATDIGTYLIKATPKTNYAWPNGGTEERTFEWSIVDSSYTIEFDGAGGSGSMDPVTLVRDEPYVVANAFTKKGCEFVTWRTVIGGVATNFDVGVTVSNLTSEAGAHLTFTADWLGRYTVAFDRNGGEGTMTNVTYEADREYLLPSNAFTRSGYHFTGWATNETEVVFTNCAAVSNLAAPGETNTLFAQWERISLAEAMHCNDPSLEWGLTDHKISTATNDWISMVGDGVGDGTDSCVRQTGVKSSEQKWLVAQVSTNGDLSFRWKPTGCDGKLSFWIGPEADSGSGSRTNLTGTAESWSTFSMSGISAGSWIHIYFYSSVGICDIDRMTWTPEGSEPKYVDVDSEVTGFSMADGKLVFAFNATNDETSAYHLLGTNDLVAPMPWPLVFEIGKPSGSSSFAIPVKEDEPKMFYRIRALR